MGAYKVIVFRLFHLTLKLSSYSSTAVTQTLCCAVSNDLCSHSKSSLIIVANLYYIH